MDSSNEDSAASQEGENAFPLMSDSILDELFPSLGDTVPPSNPLALLLNSLGSSDDRGGASLYNPFNLSPPRLHEIHAIATANLISQTQEAIMQEYNFSEFDFGKSVSSDSSHPSAKSTSLSKDEPSYSSLQSTTKPYKQESISPVTSVTKPEITSSRGSDTNIDMQNEALNEHQVLNDLTLRGKQRGREKNDQANTLNASNVTLASKELELAVQSINDCIETSQHTQMSSGHETILNIPVCTGPIINGNFGNDNARNVCFNHLTSNNDHAVNDETQGTLIKDTHFNINQTARTTSDMFNNNIHCISNSKDVQLNENAISNNLNVVMNQLDTNCDQQNITSTLIHCDGLSRTLLTTGTEVKPSKLETVEIETPTLENEAKIIFVCRVCLKQFSSEANLDMHCRNHQKYVCTYADCVKTFASRSHSWYHQQTHNGKRTYQCDMCGKAFMTGQHLDAHRRTHTQDKPFSCTECGKGFTTEGNLKNHLRLHSGEKPYACDVPNCKKSFTELSSLKKHKVTHTGEKKYKCEICNKGFTQASSRSYHMKKHKDKGT